MKIAFVVLAVALIALLPSSIDAFEQRKLACFFTSWSQNRNDTAKFLPEDIDPNLCDYILYAYADLKGDELVHMDSYDVGNATHEGLYKRVINLKKINPNLKVLISLGGQHAGSKYFSNLVHNETARHNFVKSSLAFVKQHRFDGLDVNWKTPGSRDGSKPDDKYYFTTLLKELNLEFRPHNLALTIDVSGKLEEIEKAYEIEKIAQYVDFINILAYEYNGHWASVVGHPTPLSCGNKNDCNNSVLLAVQKWIQGGAPSDKLFLTIPSYGRTITLLEPKMYIIGSKSKGPGLPGNYTGEKGCLAYFEICEKIFQDWSVKFNSAQKVTYAWNKNQWVGYESIQSLKFKADLIKEYKMGGATIWTIDYDDFRGSFCFQGNYPFINYIKKNIIEETKPKEKKGVVPKTPVCANGDGFYVDKDSKCKKFQLCMNDGTDFAQVHSFECPGRLRFNSKTKVCDYGHMVKCD